MNTPPQATPTPSSGSRRPTIKREDLSTLDALAAAAPIMAQAKQGQVRYALAGGIAMHLYGFTRATKDVDFVASALLDLPELHPLTFGGAAYGVPVGNRVVEVGWIVRSDEKRDVYEAALAHATETEEGLPILSAEWLAMVKMLAGRGKDEMDLLWLLREDGLVNRDEVDTQFRQLYGRAAFRFVDDFRSVCLEADLMRARDERSDRG
jgi:hypothetical protein